MVHVLLTQIIFIIKSSQSKEPIVIKRNEFLQLKEDERVVCVY